MDSIYNIALIFSGNEWVESFHRHCTNTGDIRIRALVYDVAALQNENFEACVISNTHPQLNQSLVKEIHTHNQKVIVVCDDNPSSRDYLARIGVDAIFSERLEARELANSIVEVLTAIESNGSRSSSYDISREISTAHDVTPAPAMHNVTGFIGTGGTGTTEIAVRAASRSADSILIDLDLLHPSLAIRLQSEITPNILDAIEATHHGNDDIVMYTLSGDIGNFIPGVAHASFGLNIQGRELNSLLHSARQNFLHTFIDVGVLAEYSDVRDTHSTIVRNCDSLVIAADPTPVGMLRLLELFAYMTSFHEVDLSSKHVIVAFNKCYGNRETQKQLQDEVRALPFVDSIYFLPYDAHIHTQTWTHDTQSSRKFTKDLQPLLNEIHNHQSEKEVLADFSDAFEKESA